MLCESQQQFSWKQTHVKPTHWMSSRGPTRLSISWGVHFLEEGLVVPTCEVSGVQTNNCIVAATAILPAACAPSFPSVTSIAESLNLTLNRLGCWRYCLCYESACDLVIGLLRCNKYQQPQIRSTVDMLFVVRRLQEVARRRRIPLYMCFVDLQKAYDSVDRELLWKVLARAGVPEEMIAVLRQFHDGMQAQVRMDDGELSDWFEVTQGLRQGCVLSPLLFNIFFAAATEVVLVRFSEDDTILKDLVYLEEEAGVWAETPLERARRAVWGMFYADDAGVVSRSQEGLARMMTTIVEVFGGIWPDSVGEEDRDSLDAGAGETAEERGIAATTTCHRSSGAKVRPDHPVPILG